MEECSQNGFAIEMRTLPLIFLPFDKEKANEKNYLIHLLLLNYSLKCHFLYLVTVYDNFFMSQYAKNFFFNFHFQYFLLWYNKDLYSLYHEFLGVTMSFLNCYYFFNIPVIVFFWCNGPGQFLSLHYLIWFFYLFKVCTSRFWFNYRHVANTLSVYRSVKRLGIPDRWGNLDEPNSFQMCC